MAGMPEHYVTAMLTGTDGLDFIACRCGWLASAHEDFVENVWQAHREGRDV